MHEQFDPQRFELVDTDKVKIAGYRFGHNMQGELTVWIEKTDRGERFLSQIAVHGKGYPVRKEVYTSKCYILREKATERYWFLDLNGCGFWLHNETFSGAMTFAGKGAVKIQEWLANFVILRGNTPPAARIEAA